MKKGKKYLSLVLAVVFVFALTLSGCGTKTAGTPAAEPAASSAEPAAQPAAGPSAEPAAEAVTLKWYLVGPGQEPDTDMICKTASEYLQSKGLNVNIELQVFGYGDAYNQKVNTMLASGEKFDIAFTASWAADFRTNANSGYFLALDDYLSKDKTIVDVVGQSFMEGIKINGKTYAVPCNKEQVHNWGFLVKKDLADKYQLDPTKITKMEEMEPFFDQIKKNEPGITPLLVAQMDAPFKLLDWDTIGDDDVPGALYPDNRDDKIINQFTAPESIAHYKKMAEYMKKGYISADAATAENLVDIMKSGKGASAIQSLKPGKDAEMKSSTGGIDWVQVDITKPVMSNRETSGGALLAIPAASEHPDEAFRFISMLYTDTYLTNLFIYGIEGTHYEKVAGKDNVITLLGGEKSGYKAGNGWRFGDQFKDYLMDNEDPDKWNKFLEYNKAGLVMNSLGFAFDKTSVDTEVAACKAVVQAYYKQLFTGSVNIDKTVAQMEAELKQSGVDKVIAEMQTQYNAFRANAGK